jgi:hypothetical protein
MRAVAEFVVFVCDGGINAVAQPGFRVKASALNVMDLSQTISAQAVNTHLRRIMRSMMMARPYAVALFIIPSCT